MKLTNLLNSLYQFSIYFSITIILASCGGEKPKEPPPPLIQAILLSFPNGSTPAYASNALVSISDGSTGANITTASVTINNTSLTYNTAATHQQYEGNISVAPGDTVTLVITIGSQIYTASGTQVTNYPTISAPTAGATWQANNTNTITWSGGAPLTNTFYVAGVFDTADPFGANTYITSQATGNTSLSIPAYYSITAGNRDVFVGITSNFTVPNAAPNSYLNLGGYNYSPISVTGMPITSRTLSASNSLEGITWSGTQFVTVGSPGKIFTSPDGATWVSHTSNTSKSLHSVAWSGSLFVSTGDSGTILTSPDGITWTTRNAGADTLNSITWSGTQFVAVGFYSNIFTSPDGINWTLRNTETNGDVLENIIWSGNQFIATGRGGAILTSPDGINWTKQTAPVTNGVILEDVAWSGSQYVAVGWTTFGSDIILTSPDAITWTQQTINTTTSPKAITWTGTEFVTVGGQANTGTITTSSDGITWTQQASGTSRDLLDILWTGSKLVIVGNQNAVLTSP